MQLNAIVDDQVYALTIPDALVAGAADFFDQIDRDLDAGCQMSREWVDAPNRVQRAQVVADKLLTALENGNQRVGLMMAGYLLARLPGLESVELDTHGEIQNTLFTIRESGADPDAGARAAPAPRPGVVPEPAPDRIAEPASEPAPVPAAPGAKAGLSKIAAMTQAGQDVTKVFKVGKGWRFSVFDHATGAWQDAPLVATEAEAERLRGLAFKARYEALQRGG